MEYMNTSLHKMRNNLHLIWFLPIKSKFKDNILFDLLDNF